MIFLDTHIVVWLYEGRVELFSPAAAEAIENHDLFVSPMAVMEMEYLFEIKRITQHGETIFKDLRNRIGLRMDETDFYAVVRESLALDWTRDPFDRLIVAAASLREAGLVSKDRVIGKCYRQTVWK